MENQGEKSMEWGRLRRCCQAKLAFAPLGRLPQEGAAAIGWLEKVAPQPAEPWQWVLPFLWEGGQAQDGGTWGFTQTSGGGRAETRGPGRCPPGRSLTVPGSLKPRRLGRSQTCQSLVLSARPASAAPARTSGLGSGSLSSSRAQRRSPKRDAVSTAAPKRRPRRLAGLRPDPSAPDTGCL